MREFLNLHNDKIWKKKKNEEIQRRILNKERNKQKLEM
jgi:hypothetical protein